MHRTLLESQFFSANLWRRRINKLLFKLKKCFSLKKWKNTISVISGESILAYWWKGSGERNWGDKINPWLINKLSGKDVLHTDDVINLPVINTYVCSGSILHQFRFNKLQIWGTGIISNTATIKFWNASVYAVRGPLTRQKLIENGIECPKIYGDPTFLLPQIYEADVEKNYELGLIPHYKDKKEKTIGRLNAEGVRIIDIFSDETEFIDEVNRCKCILSSSLHGLIIADAYGLKSKWIKLSDNLYGDDFKFKDYYYSIGVKNESPLVITSTTSKDDLMAECWKKKMDIDPQELLNACPFYNEQK